MHLHVQSSAVGSEKGFNYLHSRGAVIVIPSLGPNVDDWSARQHMFLPDWGEAMRCGENVLSTDEGPAAVVAMSSIRDAHNP